MFKHFSKYEINKKIALFVVLVTFMVQLFIVPEMVSHGAENTKILFNGQSLSARVNGYSATNSGTYTFNSRLIVEFSAPDSKSFNRYTVNYTADSCVTGTIYYDMFGSIKHEEFFLEGGTNVSFSSLIDGYLDSKKGSHIEKIVFEPRSKATAQLKINFIETVTYEVQKDSTVYIENDRFKVGCYLIWGGGLNYIEDKKDNDSTVTNMLNHCDTGRLVQQSYYGTMDSPYVPGYYNGSTWAYNPVQGGDQHGNKSKLVDFAVTSDAIYVKSRPLDWSKNNVPTFSYMENVYTLESDHIKVDNRFIDFSGYDHGGGKHQELPAFYTISYLDTFTYYDGKDPWTNDTLTVKSNLPFWGNSATSSQCYFGMTNENTETWCAWTSKEKGYGLGLYTPGASILLAGRHNYNGSKNPTDSSTNYVAPLITSVMQNYEPFQYSYYITAGTVSSIRNVFTKNKEALEAGSDALNKTNLSFDEANDIKAFSARKDVLITHDKLTGSAVLTAQKPYLEGGCDTYAYLNFSDVNTKNSRYLVLTYKVDSYSWYSYPELEFFVCAGDRKEAEGGYSYRESLIADSKFHSLVIDMWNVRAMNGSLLWPSNGVSLNAVRIDFDGVSAGDRLSIAGFALASSFDVAKSIGNKFKSSASSPVITGNGLTAGTNIVIPNETDTNAPGDSSGSDTNNENSSSGSDSSDNSGVTDNNGSENNSNNSGGNNSFNDHNNSNNSGGNDYFYDIDDDDVNIVLIVSISAFCGAILAGIVVAIVFVVKKKNKNRAEQIPASEPVPDGYKPPMDNSNPMPIVNNDPNAAQPMNEQSAGQPIQNNSAAKEEFTDWSKL